MSSAGEQQALESRLQILLEASAALIGSVRPEDLLPKVLELARRLNSAAACAIWRQEPETTDWRIASAIGLSPAYIDASVIRTPTGNIGEEPLCFEDVSTAARTADRLPLYEAEGIRSLIAMPMKIGGHVAATLSIYYRQRRQFSETELHIAAALANLAASAVETAELYRDQEQARARSAFLAEASAVLASSVEYEVTLAAVARLAVPQIADWCVVDLAQPDGSLRRLTVSHSEPAGLRVADEIRRKYPPDPQALEGPGVVFRTGKPEVRADVTTAMIERGARSPEHFDLLSQLGLRSYMCVPLAVRDRVLGVLTFVSSASGRRYGAADLAVAEDLARRAAMAIENAILYADAGRERAALEAALIALRANEDRLLLAIHAARLGIWEWDLATGDMEWSGDSAAIPGISADTFEAFAAAVHPDDRGAFLACVERAIEQKSNFECEFRMPAADGAARWLASKGKLFCDASGKPERMIGICMETTERRLLEEKLRGAQKLESIGLLAGGIAHDFNNLLTGILGNASLALEMLPFRSEAAPLLENVVQASERAADLTQQLLAYSGKGRFVVEPIDLSSLVRQITDLLQATIPKLVSLRLDLAPDLPAVEADSSQLQQVIMNLVINGAEATGERGGQVSVRTALRQLDSRQIRQRGLPEEIKAGSYVCLEVRDNGCGMDGATVSRIFDPFFTTKFTGRGLGLSAVSGIVRGHKGAIQVKSTPGRGSTFEVYFPALAAPAPAAEAAADAEDLTGSGLVLVIDDEETVRATVSAALRRYGYRVETANDGAEGVEAFRRRPQEFIAVLLDLTMPVMGGERALAAIRQILPHARVIASSGYSEAEASRRFPAGEIAAFLQKPYTAAALARTVKRVAPKVLAHGRKEFS